MHVFSVLIQDIFTELAICWAAAYSLLWYEGVHATLYIMSGCLPDQKSISWVCSVEQMCHLWASALPEQITNCVDVSGLVLSYFPRIPRCFSNSQVQCWPWPLSTKGSVTQKWFFTKIVNQKEIHMWQEFCFWHVFTLSCGKTERQEA